MISVGTLHVRALDHASEISKSEVYGEPKLWAGCGPRKGRFQLRGIRERDPAELNGNRSLDSELEHDSVGKHTKKLQLGW